MTDEPTVVRLAWSVTIHRYLETAMTTSIPLPTPGMSYLAEADIPWERQTEASRRKILRLEDDL